MKCGASDGGITFVRQLSRRYRSFCLQIRRLSLRRQLFFRPFILTGLLSSGLAHFSRTNKNFEAEVSSENREGSAHIELITFGTYRTCLLFTTYAAHEKRGSNIRGRHND